jgi:hypothetical protein
MKTTLDLPDHLLRQTKSAAALRGESMKDFVRAALEDRCRRVSGARAESGWRAVFGRGKRAAVSRVDAAVKKEFSRVDEESWR